ncbi:hypothetical protein OESDEN_02988 [Oesophagostomum dentatum]|uniref:Uncharacterized protein n=1 Tax=Oesophagostomum dentatum TaxID=61180 RepID=A0A0B1TMJ9_OESDE|nr:hypothetical protein OESDEN_02988 [Oesophagostomum dentatum]
MGSYQQSAHAYAHSFDGLPPITSLLPMSSPPYEPQYYTGVSMGSARDPAEMHGMFTNYYSDMSAASAPAYSEFPSHLQSYRQEFHEMTSNLQSDRQEFHEMTSNMTKLRTVTNPSEQKRFEEYELEVAGDRPQPSPAVEEQQQKSSSESERLSALAKRSLESLRKTLRATRKQFAAVSIQMRDYENPILLYNAPDTDRCYSFCFLERNDIYDAYFCKGCYEETKKVVSANVNGTFFQTNPTLLRHVCHPKLLTEEISNYTRRLIKMPLRKYLVVSRVQPGAVGHIGKRAENTGTLDRGTSPIHENPGPSELRRF